LHVSGGSLFAQKAWCHTYGSGSGFSMVVFGRTLWLLLYTGVVKFGEIGNPLEIEAALNSFILVFVNNLFMFQILSSGRLV
jgi:hypothetical protein